MPDLSTTDLSTVESALTRAFDLLDAADTSPEVVQQMEAIADAADLLRTAGGKPATSTPTGSSELSVVTGA